MTGGPLVSVIVPVWNPGARLVGSLESIRTQSYTNLEVLCIDDGCTDGSSEVLASYAATDPRFRVIPSGGRVGEGGARNLGLDRARGAYVLFVDADDRITQDAVTVLVQLAEDTGSELVRGSLVTEYPRGDRSDQPWETVPAASRVRFADQPQLHVPWGFTSFLYSRALIERLGLRFGTFVVGADAVFLVTCLTDVAHVSMTPTVTYRYNQIPPSIRRGLVQLEDNVRHVGVLRELLEGSGHASVWLERCGPFFAAELRETVTRAPTLRDRLRLAAAAHRSLAGASLGATLRPWQRRGGLLRAAVLGPARKRGREVAHRVAMWLRRAPYRAYRALPLPVREAYRRVRGRTEPVTSDD